MQVAINELQRRTYFKEFKSNEIFDWDGNKKFDVFRFDLPFEDDLISKWPLGYIENFKNNLLYMTSDGKLSYYKYFFPIKFENLENNFKPIQINTNYKNFILNNKDLNECFNINDYVGANGNSYVSRHIRDTLVFNDHLYVAMIDIRKKNKSCYLSTIVLKGKIDLSQNNIEFETFFEVNDEADLYNPVLIDTHSGGVLALKNGKILLGFPDYGIADKAQIKSSPFGKIIEIINKDEFKVISLGHRNPQGLYFDIEQNEILETEHGPQGGDEINLIKQDKNYGWPITSYYRDEPPRKATISREHKPLGFEEPLWAMKSQKEWDFNIAPSRILKFNNKYLVLSMSWAWNSGHGILEYERSGDKLNLVNKYHLFSRVRDILKVSDKLLVAVLESTNEIIILKSSEEKKKEINFNSTIKKN